MSAIENTVIVFKDGESVDINMNWTGVSLLDWKTKLWVCNGSFEIVIKHFGHCFNNWNDFLDKGSPKVLSFICFKMLCHLVDIFI